MGVLRLNYIQFIIKAHETHNKLNNYYITLVKKSFKDKTNSNMIY